MPGELARESYLRLAGGVTITAPFPFPPAWWTGPLRALAETAERRELTTRLFAPARAALEPKRLANVVGLAADSGIVEMIDRAR